jgi:recombination protein RecA
MTLLKTRRIMELEDYLAKLDPTTAKRVKVAQDVELIRLPLASVGLTNALQGGIGAGRITLIYGNTSAGKSVLMYQSIAQWQKEGLMCLLVDAEGTYAKDFGARLGIDNDKLLLVQSKSSGRIEKEITPHIEAGVDIIVIDSISHILPEVFIEKDGHMADQDHRKQLGAHAKAITSLVNGIHFLNEKTAVVLISQTTTQIEQTYVKQVPHGGKKVLFASSQIIKVTSSNTENQQIKGEVPLGDMIVTEPIGRSVEYYVEKNKMGYQSGKGQYDLYYRGSFVGIDTTGEVLDLAEKFGLVKKKGAWYTYEDKQYQGRTNLINHLKGNEESFELLKKELTQAMTGEIVEV